MRICSFPECEKKHFSFGYCCGHSAQLRRGASLKPLGSKPCGLVPRPLEERFWESVDRGEGCWEWQGALKDTGYGQMQVTDMGRPCTTHRISWFLHHGEWPTLHVLHRCDNRKCVRPDHLFLGTNADNVRDMVSKGRNAKGIRAGGKLTADNVDTMRRLYRDGMGQSLISRLFGVNRSWVSRVCADQRPMAVA